jgi:PAS domain S-box-containing protein
VDSPKKQQTNGETKADTPTNAGSSALVREALFELQTSNEELRVAEEEMQVQNKALMEAALMLEAEQARYRDIFHASPDPSLLTDMNGLIQEANVAAHELLGVGPRSLKGKPLAVYIALDSRRLFRAELMGRQGVREHGVYLQSKRRGLQYATLRVSPVPDAGGRPVGLRWLVRGATPDPRAELERYRRLMAEVRDFAILTLDATGQITSWNAGAVIIFGYEAAEVLGRPVHILFTPEDQADGMPDQEMARAAGTGRADDERWHLRKDGTRLWGSGVMTALRDESGGPPWYAKIVRDLTERRLHEQRKHTVAIQLQASVQPAAPTAMPGLALRTCSRPAHRELSVGGDFFDVFGLGDGRSVLSVGDVSGKGVEAASQVATVRNMLRFACYNSSLQAASPDDGPALVEAITALNRTLTGQELLAGLVTLFVGLFDPQARTLTYVNCGQEAALLHRAATGQGEALRDTGPLLGLEQDSVFTARQVSLSARDVLTIFTDGLTDIGPARTQMWGEEGVQERLQDTLATLDGLGAQRAAELIAARLTQAVDDQPPENVPDDICVLIAVAE